MDFWFVDLPAAKKPQGRHEPALWRMFVMSWRRVEINLRRDVITSTICGVPSCGQPSSYRLSSSWRVSS
jgi:hypothetical protein